MVLNYNLTPLATLFVIQDEEVLAFFGFWINERDSKRRKGKVRAFSKAREYGDPIDTDGCWLQTEDLNGYLTRVDNPYMEPYGDLSKIPEATIREYWNAIPLRLRWALHWVVYAPPRTLRKLVFDPKQLHVRLIEHRHVGLNAIGYAARTRLNDYYSAFTSEKASAQCDLRIVPGEFCYDVEGPLAVEKPPDKLGSSPVHFRVPTHWLENGVSVCGCGNVHLTYDGLRQKAKRDQRVTNGWTEDNGGEEEELPNDDGAIYESVADEDNSVASGESGSTEESVDTDVDEDRSTQETNILKSQKASFDTNDTRPTDGSDSDDSIDNNEGSA